MKKALGIIIGIILFLGIIGAACGDEPADTSSKTSSVSSGVVSEVKDVSEGDNIVSPNTSSKDTASSKKPSSSTTSSTSSKPQQSVGTGKAEPVSTSKIPAYSGNPYVTLNNNTPNFSSSELTTKGYEKYASLDKLGRCGVALASCGKEIMPKAGEERGSISNVYPSGWKQAKYTGISGGWLWNRCHLIGWQLSAENANTKNLITGTRYMNIEGMLLFENMVADYIKETNNHVAYRITPIFEGNNLVCSGVQMEAYSIEDKGAGICFNVYCYNVQPGITINYATGDSSGPSSTPSSTPSTSSSNVSSTPVVVAPTTPTQPETQTPTSQTVYTTATGKKYHSSRGCRGLSNANAIYESTLSAAQNQGLGACGWCY